MKQHIIDGCWEYYLYSVDAVPTLEDHWVFDVYGEYLKTNNFAGRATRDSDSSVGFLAFADDSEVLLAGMREASIKYDADEWALPEMRG